ncbi:hypothetical protein JHL18_09875 [Clostridium sp. YIM B02505]|uniref:Uncharacterized protein n=1 Tax=Clostridium yunnanense TaxID=2800325 RepID=A0ABS1ENP4_9CLOT|nr:hypothetical protein [Clostridium yunnanense]MBK1810933.1 hypothetical protein [Clostridium yunnanense]
MFRLKGHKIPLYLFCVFLIIRIALLILELSYGLKLLGLYSIDIINFCTLISSLVAARKRWKTIVYPISLSLIVLNLVILMFKYDTKEVHIKTPDNKNTLVVMETFKFRLVQSDLYRKSFGVFKKSLHISFTANEADRPFTNKEYTLTQKDKNIVHLKIDGTMNKEVDINFDK